jgi:hypothetical protein
MAQRALPIQRRPPRADGHARQARIALGHVFTRTVLSGNRLDVQYDPLVKPLGVREPGNERGRRGIDHLLAVESNEGQPIDVGAQCEHPCIGGIGQQQGDVGLGVLLP